MALNKRKVLDGARKFAQKGAKAKALKEYNRLLAADPRDAKLLLEVGDAYRRWGQAEEAIAQYSKVALQYRQDGFDARAVAVFKQILNLDPKHYAAYVSLSELYQRMGLESEAIAALQTAADGYHKEGRKTEALELLRQMAALDPANTTSRLKVAELLRQEGMKAEALAEYQAVATELENQQDRDQLITVLERILELRPDELGALNGLVRNLIVLGKFDRAEPLAVRALNVSSEPAQYEQLIDLYAQVGDETKLADATRGLAKLYRERGDEDKARELMQRLPVEEVGSSSRLAVDVSEVAEPDLDDEELLDEEPFLSLSDPSEDLGALAQPELGFGDAEIDADLGVAEPAPLPEAAAPEALPEGDPDQLLAEASVYLRYGKRDQAIASLRAIIAQEPTHRAAFEKLGEAYAASDRPAEAIEAWTKAAERMREAGDRDALDVLRDRIAAIDPVAADRIAPLPAPAASKPSAPEADLGLDLDVDLDLDSAIDEVAESETGSGFDADADADTGEDEFEIEIDDGSLSMDADDAEAAHSTSIDETAPELSDDDSFTFEFDEDDEVSDSPATSSPGSSTTTAARIDEELEEAQFYLAQEMYDEAEEIVKRILEQVPNHPSAMLRMGEIEAARGNAPAKARPAPVPEITDDASAPVAEAPARDFEITARFDEDDASAEAADDDGGFEIDLDLDEDDDEGDTLGTAAAAAAVEPEPEALAVDEDDSVAVEVEEEAAPELDLSDDDEPEAPVAHDPGDSFDLREALADVLSDDDDTHGNGDSGVLSTVEDGFGSIFSDFKKGVSETLGKGDYETRYDLGIAYREMGLFEDAIGEFRVCLESPARRFDSLYLMGLCTQALGRFDEAVNHLEQALALPDIPTERLAGVYFDLSRAQHGAGDLERASASARRVIELDPDFPGAAERLEALESGDNTSPKLGQPGEGFESFDELFEDEDDEGGDEAMVEAVPVETFESFDDVVSEAESDDDSTESGLSNGDSQNGDSQTGRKSGRKKISFV